MPHQLTRQSSTPLRYLYGVRVSDEAPLINRYYKGMLLQFSWQNAIFVILMFAGSSPVSSSTFILNIHLIYFLLINNNLLEVIRNHVFSKSWTILKYMFSVGHSIIIEWCQFLMIESFKPRPLSATLLDRWFATGNLLIENVCITARLHIVVNPAIVRHMIHPCASFLSNHICNVLSHYV